MDILPKKLLQQMDLAFHHRASKSNVILLQLNVGNIDTRPDIYQYISLGTPDHAWGQNMFKSTDKYISAVVGLVLYIINSYWPSMGVPPPPLGNIYCLMISKAMILTLLDILNVNIWLYIHKVSLIEFMFIIWILRCVWSLI